MCKNKTSIKKEKDKKKTPIQIIINLLFSTKGLAVSALFFHHRIALILPLLLSKRGPFIYITLEIQGVGEPSIKMLNTVIHWGCHACPQDSCKKLVLYGITQTVIL